MEKRKACAKDDLRNKKVIETFGGSHEEDESRHLGTGNGDPANGVFGDGGLRMYQRRKGARTKRVRFAEEGIGGDEGGEGGGSGNEAVVRFEGGKVAEGTVECVQYRSPMKLRSRDRGERRKIMYGDSEVDGGFAKKRMQRRKGILKRGVMEVHDTGDKKKEKRTSTGKTAVKNLDVARKGTNTCKDEETARERVLGIGKSSSQKKRKSQLMESESDAVINKEAKGKRRSKYDPKWLEEECRMCHQCQRNDKDRIVRCEKCKRKRFCAPCIENW